MECMAALLGGSRPLFPLTAWDVVFLGPSLLGFAGIFLVVWMDSRGYRAVRLWPPGLVR